jgi:hypothetical protein
MKIKDWQDRLLSEYRRQRKENERLVSEYWRGIREAEKEAEKQKQAYLDAMKPKPSLAGEREKMRQAYEAAMKTKTKRRIGR